MILKNAYVYRNGTRRFEKIDIVVKDGKIQDIGDFSFVTENTVELGGKAVVPGLVDVHTHGRAGFDFVSANINALPIMARDYAAHGVTTVMPTIASAPWEQMLSAASTVNNFVAGDEEATFCGVHLEGRYINPLRKGAHAEELIKMLSPNELENEVFRMCKLLHITAAYELDSDGSFAKKALDIGATLGLGHTNATFSQAKFAESRGVTSYTHLFNAMPPFHHREGGAICAALMGDGFAEIICDGIHVCADMVRFAYSILGSARTVLISDSMEATGCPDGEYSIAGNPAVVKNDIALTPDGALAGSTLTLDRAVNNLMEFCGIPLEEAILCATENPAKMIGAFDDCGSIDIGKRADLIVIENTNKIDIANVMVNGKFISK